MDLIAQIYNPVLNGQIGNVPFGSQTPAYANALSLLIKNAINIALGLGGVYFFFNLLKGGFEYINGGGDKDKIHQAYERIKNSLIGVIIIFSSFVILFIIETVFGISIRNANLPNL
jgi:hypothetical protein